MALYIGKNHDDKDSTSVQSIFRLIGSDENALTYALGYLLAFDQFFCAKVVRLSGVAPRRTLGSEYEVYLQEFTDRKFGLRDIVIQGNGVRIVIEAKIGNAEPGVEQLTKYGAEERLWSQYKTRGVVALTQVELSAATREQVSSLLSEKGIRFSAVQWHQILDLALSHKSPNASEVSRLLFSEFIRYIRRDYQMGYYDVEISIQDVNEENENIFRSGWIYVTAPRDKKAPLYFAPYFTGQSSSPGISMISRVVGVETTVLAEMNDVVLAASEKNLDHWRKGLDMIRQRHDYYKFSHMETRLLYLDEPFVIRSTPLTKSTFNKSNPPKRIPNQIPKGFGLTFQELLVEPDNGTT